MLITLLLSAALLQAVNPCDTNVQGPFIVTSARSFTVQWCTTSTRQNADGTAVPERIDGFYFVLDGGVKQDIGMATALGLSSITNRHAWQYAMPSGVSRGDHSAGIIAWNFLLDSDGQPTTTRVESAPTVVPFSAVDPVSNQPPLAPTGGRIIK